MELLLLYEAINKLIHNVKSMQ